MTTKPTRTHGTVKTYSIRLAGIITMARRDGYLQDSDTVSPAAVSQWLIDHKSQYCAATFRQYRAAISCWLEQSLHPDLEVAFRILYAPDQTVSAKRGSSTKTSASKEKKFSEEDRQLIMKWLSRHRSRYSAALTVLLAAGTLVGLRPSEWKTAKLTRNNGYAVLEVSNAKATNGRSNGGLRTLQLSDMPAAMIDLIDHFIKAVRNFDKLGKWNNLYDGCRKTLHKACRDLWPNRKRYPSLYSLRHQFAADVKSAGMSKVEVAALMGHASPDTASHHYGKRRVGRGRCSVRPSESDVARLQDKVNSRIESVKRMNQ